MAWLNLESDLDTLFCRLSGHIDIAKDSKLLSFTKRSVLTKGAFEDWERSDRRKALEANRKQYKASWAREQMHKGVQKTLTDVVDGLSKRNLYGLALNVAAEHHVTVDELLDPSSKRSTRRIVIARRALFLALFNEGFSIGDIGKMLNRSPNRVAASMRDNDGTNQ